MAHVGPEGKFKAAGEVLGRPGVWGQELLNSTWEKNMYESPESLTCPKEDPPPPPSNTPKRLYEPFVRSTP